MEGTSANSSKNLNGIWRKLTARFRRVTSSGNYIPEVDGLRFIAIFQVVVLLHLANFMRENQLQQDFDRHNFAHLFIMEGWYGVPLFFAISGFILSLPFAKAKLLGEEKPSLGKYYRRRFFRIEPPYFVAMTLFFILKVWVLHYESFAYLFPHFLATITYTHNIVYGYPSEIMGIAWSLEVEAQFYLLAPVITNIFFIRNQTLRRSILFLLVGCGAVFSFYWRQYSSVQSFLDQGCYFFVGILLADLYLMRKRVQDNSRAMAVLAVVLFGAFLCIPAYEVNAVLCVTKALLMLLLMYVLITNTFSKRLLSISWIAIIGGMCYSIYLVHMGVFGLLRHGFFYIQLVENTVLNIAIISFISLVLVMLASGCYFLLVEKPTMKPKWYQKLFRIKNQFGLKLKL